MDVTGVPKLGTLRSLRTRNFRLYFAGHALSSTGDWLQNVAQIWLVLELTGSGAALGLVSALQFGPVLLLGAWGGVVADRADRHRLLLVTTALKASLAAGLGVVTLLSDVHVSLVYAFAAALGTITAIDVPARHGFVNDLTGPDDVANAVSLVSAVSTAAHVIGPALAGILISTSGVSACFLLNAASFGAVLIALTLMRVDELHRGIPLARGRRQVREGLIYAMRTPEIRLPLLVMTILGTLSYNFRITVPLLGEEVFGGGPGLLGVLFAGMGVGSLGGALVTARRSTVSTLFFVGAVGGFGAATLLAAAMPSALLAVGCLVLVGATSATVAIAAQAMIQTRTDPSFRGRVLALNALVLMGTTPVGGPLVGGLAEAFGARAGLAIGGAVAALTCVVAGRAMVLDKQREAASRHLAVGSSSVA